MRAIDLSIGCRVQPVGDSQWYRVAYIGNGYITLHGYAGVLWFDDIQDVRD